MGLAGRSYKDAAPIPDVVVGPAGETLFIEWSRLSGNALLIALGVVPTVVAAGLTYRLTRAAR